MLTTVVMLIGLACTQASAAPPSKVLYTYDLTPLVQLDKREIPNARRLWDEVHFASSLQGIVNREKPRLYLFAVGGDNGAIDRFWLEKAREPGEWLADYTLESIPDVLALARQFREEIHGLVAYDERVPATSNVASTVAGVEDLACIRYDTHPDSLFQRLTADPAGPQLPVRVWLVHPDGSSLFTGQGALPDSATPSSGSAKCDAYLWAKERYLDTGRCNPAAMGYYIDAYWLSHTGGYAMNHALTNHDYFISLRGFFFDLAPFDDEAPVDDPGQPLGTDTNTLKALLRSAYEQRGGKGMLHIGGFVPWDTKYTSVAGGKHEPVPVEWRMVEVLSCYNAYVDADALGLNAMANASVWRHYPLAKRYPQEKPSSVDLRAKGYLLADGSVAPKHYVTCYVGDYDSAAWVYQVMPEKWFDPARGSIPLGWAINPNLAERFPFGLAWLRKTKTDNDFFVAGDSGAGYINPGYLVEPRTYSGLPSGLKAWRNHCIPYYRRWDLSVTGFIIDGYGPPMSDAVKDAYARFSPDGIVAQKVEPMGMHRGMPVLRMGADLRPNPAEAAKVVIRNLGEDSPTFQIYRTILWTPSQHKALFDAITRERDDAAIVDPYTLFLLLKAHLSERG